MVTIGNRNCSGRCGGWAGDGYTTQQISDTIINSKAKCPFEFKEENLTREECIDCHKNGDGVCHLLKTAQGASPHQGRLGHCLPLDG